ncbi:MAG: hypothetical protein DME50_08165 [Verrucomicrobia bacterium]|nr:MAG: hypothetical protein DME50_08165 [Verrucomicrobiota bacterium]
MNPVSSLNSTLEIANLASLVSNMAHSRRLFRTSPNGKNGLNLRLIPDSHFGQHKDQKNASGRGIV